MEKERLLDVTKGIFFTLIGIFIMLVLILIVNCQLALATDTQTVKEESKGFDPIAEEIAVVDTGLKKVIGTVKGGTLLRPR